MEILPFTAKLPPNFGPGSILKFEGKPQEPYAWLSITLLDGNQILDDRCDEVKQLGLFQIQLRYDEGVVVMNSVGPGSVGEEQRYPRGYDMEKIEIEIRVTDYEFKVYLEDVLIGSFNHRENPSRARYCNVYGEFQVKKFSHSK